MAPTQLQSERHGRCPRISKAMVLILYAAHFAPVPLRLSIILYSKSSSIPPPSSQPHLPPPLLRVCVCVRLVSVCVCVLGDGGGGGGGACVFDGLTLQGRLFQTDDELFKDAIFKKNTSDIYRQDVKT